MSRVFLMFVAVILTSSSWRAESMRVGFYSSSCPSAELIIRKTVAAHFRSDRTIAAGLLRLAFHDCFVQGCDGSILLDKSRDGSVIEKESPANKNSVRGYEVIDDAKKQLESVCPSVVSCADIVQLAARDGVALTNGPHWELQTGRLDGRVSRASEANQNLPGPSSSVAQMTASFAKQGLTSDDLVNLLGAHTIGRTRCIFVQNRLYNFSGTGQPDPTLDKSYLVELRRACPPDSAGDLTVVLDRGTEFKFDSNYFKELMANRGALTVDQVLTHDASTQPLVQTYSVPSSKAFFKNFITSMKKMANINVKKTSSDGEIRLDCRAPNTLSEVVSSW